MDKRASGICEMNTTYEPFGRGATPGKYSLQQLLNRPIIQETYYMPLNNQHPCIFTATTTLLQM